MIEYVGYMRQTQNTGYNIRVDREYNQGNEGFSETVYEGKGYNSRQQARDCLDQVIDVFKSLDNEKDSATDWVRV